jgi:putative membrane protein
MMDPYWNYGWGGMMGFGGLMMLLFWVLLIAGAIVLLRRLRARNLDPGDRPAHRSALDILNERYARGDIEREEFEQKRRDLER